MGFDLNQQALNQQALDQQVIDGDDDGLRAALSGAGLPVDDLTEAGRRFYRFSQGGDTVGFGGLELHGEAALLRSIMVLPDRRGFGFGHAITSGLLGLARGQGAACAYLLTESAAPFFQSLGFRPIARDEAPGEILATRQAADLCPASASLMVRGLPL
ncbi:N-acetylglutamate synthase-like GNAT family acetyltransferase [Rhizobium sp. BK650]|uniref:arsenic resistance N-acetyltransferase ArsN2 n=1 Tax=Rhizobium sp. BK650 TaxID=2586990 RepID=UPI0016080D8A|nr:arsenic resistance N-acetyltransferase ArsN2 [Rhizobium sp. BK650]MBB3655815.1 N-acetylglutamate synthase-like GNAT family acetyltransferase [Rhizobium sp. BK650]